MEKKRVIRNLLLDATAAGLVLMIFALFHHVLPREQQSLNMRTAKPAETRMGSGKGSVEYWVAVVKPGRVMFEIAGVPEEVAKEALRLATHKLPCKCKIVSKADLEGGNN